MPRFTVRNYCRLRRIRGLKKGSGRGKYQSWIVSHAEIERVRREGLLPPRLAAIDCYTNTERIAAFSVEGMRWR